MPLSNQNLQKKWIYFPNENQQESKKLSKNLAVKRKDYPACHAFITPKYHKKSLKVNTKNLSIKTWKETVMVLSPKPKIRFKLNQWKITSTVTRGISNIARCCLIKNEIVEFY